MEVLSEYEFDGFVCFKDFCLIVSEKLNNEDDEFLIKSIFKSFKGSAIPSHQTVKAPKRNFYHEVVTFDEFRGERLHIEKLFRSMDKNNDGWVAREVMNSIQIESRLVLNKNKLNYKTDIITSIVQSVSP